MLTNRCIQFLAPCLSDQTLILQSRAGAIINFSIGNSTLSQNLNLSHFYRMRTSKHKFTALMIENHPQDKKLGLFGWLDHENCISYWQGITSNAALTASGIELLNDDTFVPIMLRQKIQMLVNEKAAQIEYPLMVARTSKDAHQLMLLAAKTNPSIFVLESMLARNDLPNTVSELLNELNLDTLKKIEGLSCDTFLNGLMHFIEQQFSDKKEAFTINTAYDSLLKNLYQISPYFYQLSHTQQTNYIQEFLPRLCFLSKQNNTETRLITLLTHHQPDFNAFGIKKADLLKSATFNSIDDLIQAKMPLPEEPAPIKRLRIA